MKFVFAEFPETKDRDMSTEIALLPEGSEVGVAVYDENDLESYYKALKDADAICSGFAPLDRACIDRLKNCKIISVQATGYNFVDYDYCREKGITFDMISSSRNLMVNADLDRIQQVLYNLIDNAIKFSPRDSVITIETSSRHELAFISVKDNGVGIAKENINKIWDRFYKTDTSRGKDKKGTGLGLSIVKEIIQAHGTNIDVISTEGVGTEFIFTLNLAEKEPEV